MGSDLIASSPMNRVVLLKARKPQEAHPSHVSHSRLSSWTCDVLQEFKTNESQIIGI